MAGIFANFTSERHTVLYSPCSSTDDLHGSVLAH